ncbi:MAG: tripartite tricarboxylate transporter substrate binding protein [Betaproteobacteria bacterium]|nr:tripartite tricarboxylate transporter substrate binding protein [Betaproteobacteria bacterium]
MNFLLGFLLAMFSTGLTAQDLSYPHKGNIEITVLFPAGSSADITARVLAEGLGRQLGVNVLVVNRPGAGGGIGYKYVAGQKPDGYSLVWNSNSISTTFHSGQLAFDYKAFDAVARVLVESPLVAVRSDAKWKTLGDLIADARARPGRITVANSGTGSHTHISSVALFSAVQVAVVDVPHGAAQVVPNLLGGHVEATVQLPGALASHIKSGSVRALAALIPKRDPALPEVPTAREQGVNVSLEAWRGIAVPRGTPIGVIAVLEHAIRRTVESPEFTRSCEKYAVRPAFMPAAEFGELIAKEDAELAVLMQSIGLKKNP